jgi:glycerol-3-phosphate acyltransferase PlsX
MKVIVDAMGGDYAPGAAVEGALQANRELGVEIILVGRTEEILKAMEATGIKELPAGVEIHHATEVIEIEDDAATAFKKKKDSSMTVGLTLLRDGVGDAFVSAGSTGALLSGATLMVKRIKGIRRAAMAPTAPVFGGRAILCDCGANAECTPEYLLQFAYLASLYAQKTLGLENPRVGLLNIGEEREKGDSLRLAVYPLLEEAHAAGRINFIGNIEGNTAMMGGADVLVADGYSGNIFLKSVEGAGKFMAKEMKKMFTASAKTKVAALLMKDQITEFKKLLDPNEVGGVPFLGICKPVIKAHGSSNAWAIRNAVRQAQSFAQSTYIADVQANIEFMKVNSAAENA